jgi:hypothetical protein
MHKRALFSLFLIPMVTTIPDSMNTETNVITLSAPEDSKIAAVSLYSGRAEVTRLFKFEIKAGQNKVTIFGLPRSLQEDSLRYGPLKFFYLLDTVNVEWRGEETPPSTT